MSRICITSNDYDLKNSRETEESKISIPFVSTNNGV
jgi:hypothetical protein